MIEYTALTTPPDKVPPSKVKRCGRFTSRVTNNWRLWTFRTKASRDKFCRKYGAERAHTIIVDTRGD